MYEDIKAKEQLPETYRVVLQIVFMQKFTFLIRWQVVESVAEKINFLLYKPTPEIFP